MEGYSPWGHKEVDMTEHARMLPVDRYCVRLFTLIFLLPQQFCKLEITIPRNSRGEVSSSSLQKGIFIA